MSSYFKILEENQNFKFLKISHNVPKMEKTTLGIDKENIQSYYYPAAPEKILYYPDVLYYYIHNHKKISASDKEWFLNKCQKIAKNTNDLNKDYVYIEASKEFIEQNLLGKDTDLHDYFYTNMNDIVKGETMLLRSYQLYHEVVRDYEEVNKKLKDNYSIKKSTTIAYHDRTGEFKHLDDIKLKDYRVQVLKPWSNNWELFLNAGKKLEQHSAYYSSKAIEFNNEIINTHLIEVLGKKVLDKKGIHYFPLVIQTRNFVHFKIGLYNVPTKQKFNFSNLNDINSYKNQIAASRDSNTPVLVVKEGIISSILIDERCDYKNIFDSLNVIIEREYINQNLENQRGEIENTIMPNENLQMVKKEKESVQKTRTPWKI